MTLTGVNERVRGGAPLEPPAKAGLRSAASAGAAHASTDGARLGPNSVTQTLRALRELEGAETAQRIVAQAGLPAQLPPGMIPEGWFLSLLQAVRTALPVARAEAVLRLSGRYTAAYVAQNRIPAPFRGLLRLLPARAAVPLLLFAFRQHAWTFAGSGLYRHAGGYPGVLLFDRCLTCRPTAQVAQGSLGGAWYEAAFEGLLRLAAPTLTVREVACQAAGAPLCRFVLSIGPQVNQAAPATGDA
jgi:divinyl protochlorophyllide a 8-vinyl-reductase